jgi:peptidoglycan/LPS O-acetylase OafA/YrhL
MRIEQLTFLRFVAAIALVIYHYGTKVFPFNTEILNIIFRNSNLGVSFFFVLSGYVLMLAYGNQKSVSKLEFFKKRFARIYPVYFIGIVLMVIYYLTSSYLGNGKDVDFLEVLSNLFLIQAWIPQHALTINFVGWSLSVEVLFYMLFPLVLKIFNHFSLKRLVVVVFFFWGLSQISFWGLKTSELYKGFPSNSHNFIFYFPLLHLNQFLIGALGGWVFIKHQPNFKKCLSYWITALIFFAIGVKLGVDINNGLLAVVFVVVLLFFSSTEHRLVLIFNRSFFVFLGGISYSIYILQVPVFEWLSVLRSKFKVEVTEEVFFFTGGLILILVSSMGFRYVEIPIRNWMLSKK